VTLDGSNVGKTPLTLRDVPAGNHTVVLSLAGRTSATRTLELRAGAVQDLTVTLEPEAVAQAPNMAHVPLTAPKPADIPEPPPLTNVAPLPPLRGHPGRPAKIVALAALIGAAASGAALIYTYTQYRSAQDTINEKTRLGGPVPLSMDEAKRCESGPDDVQGLPCERGRTMSLATKALGGVTIGLAAVSAISFGIGEYQSQKAKKERGTFGVMRQTLRVAPVFSSTGGGLSARFEF